MLHLKMSWSVFMTLLMTAIPFTRSAPAADMPAATTATTPAGPPPPAFEPIQKAAIDASGGTARLMINGQPVAPIVFFYNTRQQTNYVERFQDPQVRLAAAAGVHLYSFLLPTPDYTKGIDQADYTAIETTLDSFIKVDPQAVFILRFWPGPNPSWPDWAKVTPDHMAQYGDGTSGQISLASDFYWDPSDQGTTALIRHFEASPYAGRVLAWHIGGPQFEMFPDLYREKGPDVSPVSTARFHTWLKAKYTTDTALQAAWGDPKVTFLSAQVPRAPVGRFPMHMELGKTPIQVFYNFRSEQNWVDYSAFASDLAADRIIRWAELVRRETGGRRLSIFCYGYISELVGSFNGHGSLQRVLDSPAIDILMSPVPYMGRTSGDPAGFMSPVDSVAAHGKLWLNEDDIRTSLIKKEDVPAWLPDGMFGQQAKDMHETLNLLDRNFAQLLMHRSATWWMDLAGCGAFNDPAPWAMLKDRLTLYNEIANQPAPYRPEVAFIYDPADSKYSVKSDWDGFYSNMIDLRNQCGRAGVAVGWYTLPDFLSGTVPACKAYLFANAFHLTGAQVDTIRARLDQEGSTALWVYAPGYLGAMGSSLEQASRLTGLKLAARDGEQGSVGEGLLSGLSWGGAGAGPHGHLLLSPRLYVDDPAAQALGHYQADGLISAAATATGKHHDIFLGDLGLSAQLLGRLFANAGANRWTTGGEVVLTDGRFLAIHAGQGGLKRIEPPVGESLQPIGGSIDTKNGNAFYVSFLDGDTRWFRRQPPAGDASAKSGEGYR